MIQQTDILLENVMLKIYGHHESHDSHRESTSWGVKWCEISGGYYARDYGRTSNAVTALRGLNDGDSATQYNTSSCFGLGLNSPKLINMRCTWRAVCQSFMPAKLFWRRFTAGLLQIREVEGVWGFLMIYTLFKGQTCHFLMLKYFLRWVTYTLQKVIYLLRIFVLIFKFSN